MNAHSGQAGTDKPTPVVLALVLLCALWLVPHNARAGDACISIKPATKTIVIGKTRSVKITVATRDGSARPRLRASSGKLAPLKQGGPNSFTTIYEPPWAKNPSVAIISATTRNAECPPAFAVIKLLVERKISADVPPNARATLRVGGNKFGPARADAKGRAEIPARLYPGYKSAILEVVKPGGQKKRRRLKLGVKRRVHIEALARPPAVRADGQSAATVYLFAVDPRGRPIKNPRFVVHSRAGSNGRPKAEGAGVYSFSFRPRPSPAGGRARVTIRLKKPFRARKVFTVRLLSGTRLDLSVESSTESLFADGESKTSIKITVRNAEGSGVEKLPIEINTSTGKLGPVSEQGGGEYRAELVAPLGGRQSSAKVVVAIGNKKKKIEIPLVMPDPLSITCTPDKLVADGSSQAEIRIRAFGPDGAPGADSIMLETSLGKIPDRVPLSGTRAEAVLTSGTRAGPARITARLGPARAELQVAFLPGPPERLTVSSVAEKIETLTDSQVPVTVSVNDVNGNPVPGVLPALTASIGEISSTTEENPGRYSAIYRPPAKASGNAVIKAAVGGGLTDELHLHLEPPPANFGISLTAGIEHNLARMGAPLFSVEGSYRLVAGLFVQAGCSYFGTQIEAACPSGPEGCSSTLRLDVVPFFLGLGYRIENSSRWTPTFSLGAAAVLARAAASPSFQDDIVETTVSPAGFARAGVEFGLGPGGILLEIGYQYAPWLGSDVVNGMLGGLSARLGYRLAL